MNPEIFFTPAALATVFLAFLCAILSDVRELRGAHKRDDTTDVVLLLCQYGAGAGAFLSLMVFFWSL